VEPLRVSTTRKVVRRASRRLTALPAAKALSCTVSLEIAMARTMSSALAAIWPTVVK
jgi:hypothetical protein